MLGGTRWGTRSPPCAGKLDRTRRQSGGLFKRCKRQPHVRSPPPDRYRRSGPDAPGVTHALRRSPRFLATDKVRHTSCIAGTTLFRLCEMRAHSREFPDGGTHHERSRECRRRRHRLPELRRSGRLCRRRTSAGVVLGTVPKRRSTETTRCAQGCHRSAGRRGVALDP